MSLPSERLDDIRDGLEDAGLRVQELGSTEWPTTPYCRVVYGGQIESEYRSAYMRVNVPVIGNAQPTDEHLGAIADYVSQVGAALLSVPGVFGVQRVPPVTAEPERAAGAQTLVQQAAIVQATATID